MPDTCPSSSTDPKPPCCWRYSTIFWTVAGPTPGNVSSCSGVAVLRLNGAAGGGGGAGVLGSPGGGGGPPAAPTATAPAGAGAAPLDPPPPAGPRARSGTTI